LTVNALTTNNDKTGYSLTQSFPSNFSALGITAGGHISNVDTLTTYTGNTVQTGDSYARIGAAGASLTGITGATLSSAYDFAKGTVAMTESYAADGAAPTPEQAIYLIQQSLHEFAISGTTRTVKKLDGATTAATFTLDSSTAPTSTTRAS